MYLSDALYGNYYKKWLLQAINPDNDSVRMDVSEARNELMLSLAKNTFMPMLFLTTVAVSLPVAVLFASLYIGYQCAPGAPKSPSSPAAPYLMVAEDESEALTCGM